MEKEFKEVCSHCSLTWNSRDEFLRDPFIKIVGYLTNFKNLETGSFLFEHSLCKNTITIEVSKFSDLYNGPIFQKPLTGTENCHAYCLYKDNLDGCKEMCECAYVRSVIQIIKHYRMIFA